VRAGDKSRAQDREPHTHARTHTHTHTHTPSACAARPIHPSSERPPPKTHMCTVPSAAPLSSSVEPCSSAGGLLSAVMVLPACAMK
jgi:hypothetical protein